MYHKNLNRKGYRSHHHLMQQRCKLHRTSHRSRRSCHHLIRHYMCIPMKSLYTGGCLSHFHIGRHRYFWHELLLHMQTTKRACIALKRRSCLSSRLSSNHTESKHLNEMAFGCFPKIIREPESFCHENVLSKIRIINKLDLSFRLIIMSFPLFVQVVLF